MHVLQMRSFHQFLKLWTCLHTIAAMQACLSSSMCGPNRIVASLNGSVDVAHIHTHTHACTVYCMPTACTHPCTHILTPMHTHTHTHTNISPMLPSDVVMLPCCALVNLSPAVCGVSSLCCAVLKGAYQPVVPGPFDARNKKS